MGAREVVAEDGGRVDVRFVGAAEVELTYHAGARAAQLAHDLGLLDAGSCAGTDSTY